MMRFRSLVAVCGCLVGTLALGACDDNELEIPALPDNGFVRVANLAVNSGTAVDVYADGAKILSAIPAGQVSDFVSLPARRYGMRVTPANNPNVTLRADSIALFGGPNGSELQVTWTAYNYTSGTAVRDTVFPFVELFREMRAGEALVRFNHLTAAAGAVTFDLGDDNLVLSPTATNPTRYAPRAGGLGAELTVAQFGSSEQITGTALRGGVGITGGQALNIGVYTAAAGGGFTRVGRAVLNVPAGGMYNASLVGGGTGGGALRMVTYDINGVEAVVPIN
ncbi:MAG TPA: DUF4397 domain-containing protein [Longimicrobium sp.]|jgi:hypothetical protein